MVRVLAFCHVPFEHLGLIAPALESKGVRYEYVDLFRDASRHVSFEGIAGLIFMGGPMSANDDHPYIHRELALIGEAAGAGMPVLGICLGAQLVAKALGGRVCANPVKEIGWYTIHWAEAARRDALFAGLSDPETVFHWHGETFDLPTGAERLAWSDACWNQAFRFGPNVYGLQFHLEVTPEMIADWLRQDENDGDVRELTVPVDPHHNARRLTELSGLVFGRWADLLPRG